MKFVEPRLEESQHESFRLPSNKDIPIWGYMDLSKYLSMLISRALFFSRATLLGDPFEGSAPRMIVVNREYIRANRTTDPALAAWKDMNDTTFDQMSTMVKAAVQTHFVSCWHMNEQESVAMWKLYSSSNESVSIRSSYRRLRLCLPPSVYVGEVNYIDYETDVFPPYQMFNYIMHKRRSFLHERELRVVLREATATADEYLSARIKPSGLLLEVELASLIEQVYVSPTAAPWFTKLVEDMTGRCGFSFPVKQSDLSSDPMYWVYAVMKFVEPRPFADPAAAARKLMELAFAFEPIQDGRRDVDVRRLIDEDNAAGQDRTGCTHTLPRPHS